MSDKRHILFDTIVNASNGDEIAINQVLEFYDGYISTHSLRPLYDDCGNVHMVLDTELKGRIQSALILALLNFEIAVI